MDVHSGEFVCEIHRRFYERLPEEFRMARTAAGRAYRIVPGSLRDFMVEVGRHTPPHFEAVGSFLERFRFLFFGGGFEVGVSGGGGGGASSVGVDSSVWGWEREGGEVA